MNASVQRATPAATTVAGAVPAADTHLTGAAAEAFARATAPDYFTWLDHVRSAAGCTRPVRLHGQLLTMERATGRVLNRCHTEDLPDRVIYKACGNRRARVCLSCSTVYQNDAYQLLRAGLAGGKGVPTTVTRHPANFATFTAPSFGAVHSRSVSHHGCADRRDCHCRPDICRPRRAAAPCPHGRPVGCFTRHGADDPALGQPLCLDCYNHDHQVVWNMATGELWRRTKQDIERYLNQLARRRGLAPVRVSHGKAAEFQARGAVHFHVLLRLDGIDTDDPAAVVPPPVGITAADLDHAIHHAVGRARLTTPPHPDQPSGWTVVWGTQIDTRPITLSGRGAVTDGMVAGYLAKYATKSTEATGHASARLTPETITIWVDEATHVGRLIDACWRLGRPDHTDDQSDNPYSRLRRWAHMLGFGGHFLTKARRYSITFTALREARTLYQRTVTIGHDNDDQTEDTTLVVGLLTYIGTGWHSAGDALLANTAAAQARDRRDAARAEVAHGLAERHTPAA